MQLWSSAPGLLDLVAPSEASFYLVNMIILKLVLQWRGDAVFLNGHSSRNGTSIFCENMVKIKDFLLLVPKASISSQKCKGRRETRKVMYSFVEGFDIVLCERK